MTQWLSFWASFSSLFWFYGSFMDGGNAGRFNYKSRSLHFQTLPPRRRSHCWARLFTWKTSCMTVFVKNKLERKPTLFSLLSQHFAYVLLRFTHKTCLVRVWKTSWFGLKYFKMFWSEMVCPPVLFGTKMARNVPPPLFPLMSRCHTISMWCIKMPHLVPNVSVGCICGTRNTIRPPH